MTTGADIEDVACKGDDAGNHSNIVTCMKRLSRCQKLATPGARKRQRDITKGMMVAEMACAGSDPCEGSVQTEALNVQSMAVNGNSLWSTMQVLRGYITPSFSAMELDLLNNQCTFMCKCSLNTMRHGGGPEGMHAKASACEWLRGLINAVLKARAGDKSGRYCIVVRMDELANDVTIDPGTQSMEHPSSMAPKSTDVKGAATDKACVDPLLGPSLETMSNPEGRLIENTRE
ncbi:hypothetical protein Cgig2_021309 [Carnegiea gigantea]|uniref:Uncharacterized protein n=1 Tax=Carnegiea gigantea TaxID=171969 RepID=A0A9Q1KJB1_9CARY|nr:hypothetical protein Cgig2_021309 [Carnegiea gigantea]